VPNLLKQLELDELSLVDRPANAQAMVSLFKRDNSNGDHMEQELEKMSYNEDKLKAYMKEYSCSRREAMKALKMEEPTEKAMSDEEKMEMDKMSDGDKKKLRAMMAEGMSFGQAMRQINKSEEIDPVVAEVDEQDILQAAVDTLKLENEMLRKALIDNGFIIKSESVEKKEEPEYIEYEGEQINKADVPAVILKALEAAELAKADAELTKRATEALPHFAEEVAKSLVAEFGDSEGIMETLKAADAVFAENMEEVGKSDADGEFATAADKIESLVKSYMEENKMHKGDYAKAYAAVAKTDEGKALINKSYKGE